MEVNHDFQEEYNDLTDEQKETLQIWINRYLQPINSINKKHGSRGLKENFEQSENGFYLPDVAFIVAMLEAGYYVDKENSLNCSFNISNKSIRKLRDNPDISSSDLPEDFNRIGEKTKETLLQWIRDNLQFINSFNASASADHLTDLFEKMTNAQITIGMMKGAMLKMGFKMRRDIYFNVSAKSISRIYWEEL